MGVRECCSGLFFFRVNLDGEVVRLMMLSNMRGAQVRMCERCLEIELSG